MGEVPDIPCASAAEGHNEEEHIPAGRHGGACRPNQ